MIIGIDATRANKAHKTGVEWYCFFLIQELVRIAPDVTFRLYFNSDPEPALRNLGPNVQYRIMRWPLVYLWTQIRLSLEMLFNPPDVLFIPASIIPLISAKRTVTTLHDVAYEVYKHDLSQKSRLYLRFSAYWAKWFCRKIITVSEFSKREIIRFYNFRPEQIKAIYLGLHWSVINRIISEPASQPKEDYVISVSRLESKKNVARLMEVFASVHKTDWGKELKLYLVGSPSRGWSEAEVIMKKNHLEAYVVRTGWISEEEKFRLIRGAKALLHFAKYEGFCFNTLEAMACGTPTVVNNVACLPETCGDAAMLVDVNDTSVALEAIHQVLVNSELRAHLIDRGYSHSRQFTWQITAKQTLEVLKSLYV